MPQSLVSPQRNGISRLIVRPMEKITEASTEDNMLWTGMSLRTTRKNVSMGALNLLVP